MNNLIDELRMFLPKFLSAESTKELLDLFKDFPENIDGRFYSSFLKDNDIVFQGDGLQNIPVIELPKTDIKYSKCIILSNTCDIDLSNKRLFPSSICYAPIISLNNYYNLLISKSQKPESDIKSHIEDIRKQRITQILYLPKGSGLNDESIVFLDKINNIQNHHIDRNNSNRLFVLSDYGLYILLLKISIHFTRIQEKVDRFKGVIL